MAIPRINLWREENSHHGARAVQKQRTHGHIIIFGLQTNFLSKNEDTSRIYFRFNNRIK